LRSLRCSLRRFCLVCDGALPIAQLLIRLSTSLGNLRKEVPVQILPAAPEWVRSFGSVQIFQSLLGLLQCQVNSSKKKIMVVRSNRRKLGGSLEVLSGLSVTVMRCVEMTQSIPRSRPVAFNRQGSLVLTFGITQLLVRLVQIAEGDVHTSVARESGFGAIKRLLRLRIAAQVTQNGSHIGVEVQLCYPRTRWRSPKIVSLAIQFVTLDPRAILGSIAQQDHRNIVHVNGAPKTALTQRHQIRSPQSGESVQ